jgi:hypothetical protein
MAMCVADEHEVPMSKHKNAALKTPPPAAVGTSRFGSEIQMSIGRSPAEQYELLSDIPERLATLLEQLVEPTDGKG